MRMHVSELFALADDPAVYEQSRSVLSEIAFGPERSSVLSSDVKASGVERTLRDWVASEQEFRAAGEAAFEGRTGAALGWGAFGALAALPFVGYAGRAGGRALAARRAARQPSASLGDFLEGQRALPAGRETPALPSGSLTKKELDELIEDTKSRVMREYKAGPAAQNFPDSSFPKTEESLYRGIRSNDQFSIDEAGNLILYPGSNFDNRLVGFSFTEDLDVAWNYASRFPESVAKNPLGIVFRVPTKKFEKVENIRDARTERPPLQFEGAEGEWASYVEMFGEKQPYFANSENVLVFRKGEWEVLMRDKDLLSKVDDEIALRVKKYNEMSDKDLVVQDSQSFSDSEYLEYSLADSWDLDFASTSDPVELILENALLLYDWTLVRLVILKRIAKHPNPRGYIKHLNELEMQHAPMSPYGRGWYEEELLKTYEGEISKTAQSLLEG